MNNTGKVISRDVFEHKLKLINNTVNRLGLTNVEVENFDASILDENSINKFLYINNLGQVSPCTWVISNNPEYKSKLTLKNSIFSEVIRSEPIQNYLKYIEENQIKGCPVSRREQ